MTPWLPRAVHGAWGPPHAQGDGFIHILAPNVRGQHDLGILADQERCPNSP